MDIKLSKTFEIVPEWNGNKEEDASFTVYCRYLSSERWSRCVSIKGTEPEVNMSRLLKESIIKIKDLSIEGKPIVTAENLLKTEGLSSLCVELMGSILIENNKEPSKN